MATFLDISGLSFFSSIFTFILIFVTVYALLTYGKILGSNSGLHSLIAISIAVLFMFSKDAISMVNFMIPWFTIMFIVIILMIMAYSLFNPGANLVSVLGSGHKTVVYWVITLSVIIILLGLSNTYGQKVGPYLSENGDNSASLGSNGVYNNDTNTLSGAADNFRGTGNTNTGDFQQNLGATIFHPKMLGMMFILLLGTFTILLMTSV